MKRAIVRSTVLALMMSPWVVPTRADETPAGIRGELLAKLQAGWPTRGVLEVQYGCAVNPDEWILAADFSTGAWKRVDRSPEWRVLAKEADGTTWGGPAVPEGVQKRSITVPDGWLDDFFPGVMLRDLLRDGDMTLAERTPDEGFHVVFMLPRGRRDLALADLPSTEVARWGGAEKILRPVHLIVDKDAMVREVRVEDGTPSVDGEVVKKFDRAGCSPDGFQVPSSPGVFGGECGLTSCTYNPSATAAFDRATVQNEIVGRRWNSEMVRKPLAPPVAEGENQGTVPSSSRTLPDSSSSGGSFFSSPYAVAMFLVGLALIVVGIFVKGRRA